MRSQRWIFGLGGNDRKTPIFRGRRTNENIVEKSWNMALPKFKAIDLIVAQRLQ
jgi:hypothetical protein